MDGTPAVSQPPEPGPHGGLVLSGGGARGAYQVGVINALAELFPGPLPFAAITGVSVGAINAAVLAEGADDFPKAAAKLNHLWRGLSSSDIFTTGPGAIAGQALGWANSVAFGWAGAQPPCSLLDAAPLEALLTREIDFDRIEQMIEQGALCAFAVTASSYTTGQSTTFFQGQHPGATWERSRRLGIQTKIRVEHILASSALPGVFKARKIGRQWYGDGALRQTAPLSPAIHLGCDQMLLIAARDGTSDDPPEATDHEPYPQLGLIGGQLLDIIFNDNLDADLERLRRINATLGTMIPERRVGTNLRALSTTLIRPSEDIRGFAGQHANEAPAAVKFILGLIGAMQPPWVLPSYLTFEPGYIGALIDLGYRDTCAAKENLTWIKKIQEGQAARTCPVPH
ncbi:MAG: patatin-like phospholipase family protein [Pseudomonadota bacterium]